MPSCHLALDTLGPPSKKAPYHYSSALSFMFVVISFFGVVVVVAPVPFTASLFVLLAAIIVLVVVSLSGEGMLLSY